MRSRNPLAVLLIALSVALPFAAPRAFAADATTRPFGGGGMLLDRAKEMIAQLDLSADQKSKVDAIFQKARTDFDELRANLDALQPPERMERIRDFMQTTRQQLSEVLTPPQREVMEKKFAEERERFRNRGGGPGAGPTSRPSNAGPEPRRPGAMLERLRDSLQQLNLSDEQKTKVKSLIEDVKAKAEDLRGQIQNGGEEAREKLRALFNDTRKKLDNILSEEQRAKLRELMGGDGAPPPAPPRPRSADASKPKADAGDQMMMEEGNSMTGSSNRKSQISNSKAETSDSKPRGPAIGETAPPLTLKKLDGSTLDLSSLKGRVVVLEFGSYSSPSFRTRAPAMEKLKNDLGSRAQFFVVYAREAHATGEWEVDRNKDEGITVEQPKTFDARKTLAGSAREKLKVTVPILVDSAENEAAKALGAGANSAYVIDRDGKIVARQEWFEPAALRRAVEDALNARATTRPAT